LRKLEEIKPIEQEFTDQRIYCTHEIDWHNLIVADSIAEAHRYVKSILEDLEKLLKFEQEGKIKAECGCDSPSFQIINVLDKSIEPELQRLAIVSCHQTDTDEIELSDMNQVSTSDDTKSLRIEDLTQSKQPISSEQIEELTESVLKLLSLMPYQLSPKQLVEEFNTFVTKKRDALAKYPAELINALIQTLAEVPLEKDWELIPEITRSFNIKLKSLNRVRCAQFSGKKVGSLLSLLGFVKRRKGDKGNLVFVDRKLLKQFKKEED
jgi:hypothetical protein